MQVHEAIPREPGTLAKSNSQRTFAVIGVSKFKKPVPNTHDLKHSIEQLITTVISILIIALWGSTAQAQGNVFEALKSKAYGGSVASQVDLGLTHLRVEDSMIDRKIGLAWVIVAASAGDAKAIQIRDRSFSLVRKDTGQDAERIAFQVRRTIEEQSNGGKNRARAKATDIVLLAGIGSAEALEELIKDGADVDVVEKDGTTPLLAAFLARRFDLAKILFAAGADPEISGPSGKPLLVEMVEHENLPAVALLKANGASIFTHDTSGVPLFQSELVGKRVKPLLEIKRRDMTRDEVREVQARLKAAGYKPGPVDGLIGRKTWSAFDELSSDKGLAIVGRNPNAALLATRTYVPMDTFRQEITAAVRSSVTAVSREPSRPTKPRKTNAQIFFAGNLPD